MCRKNVTYGELLQVLQLMAPEDLKRIAVVAHYTGERNIFFAVNGVTNVSDLDQSRPLLRLSEQEWSGLNIASPMI